VLSDVLCYGIVPTEMNCGCVQCGTKCLDTKMAHSEAKTSVFIIKLFTFMAWGPLLVAQLVEALC
jgi:hypothetical protein